jgi:hypothetical protein
MAMMNINIKAKNHIKSIDDNLDFFGLKESSMYYKSNIA